MLLRKEKQKNTCRKSGLKLVLSLSKQKAFDDLKMAMVMEPVLQLPEFDNFGWNFRFWQRPWRAEHFSSWWCGKWTTSLDWRLCGLDRSKRVGYDRLGMLSLTTLDSMGHSLMMKWLPSLCCLLNAGYLAERVNKVERVQTLLQGSNRRIASAQLLIRKKNN